MFNKTKKILRKILAFASLNAFALMLVANSVNVTCMLNHHQPVVPESAKKFRKF